MDVQLQECVHGVVRAPRRLRPDLGVGVTERTFPHREVTRLRLKESVDSKQRSIICFTMSFTNFAHFRMRKDIIFYTNQTLRLKKKYKRIF